MGCGGFEDGDGEGVGCGWRGWGVGRGWEMGLGGLRNSMERQGKLYSGAEKARMDGGLGAGDDESCVFNRNFTRIYEILQEYMRMLIYLKHIHQLAVHASMISKDTYLLDSNTKLYCTVLTRLTSCGAVLFSKKLKPCEPIVDSFGLYN